MKSMKVARMVLVGVVTGATALMMSGGAAQAANINWQAGANSGDSVTWDQSNKNWNTATANPWSSAFGNSATLGSANATVFAGKVYVNSFSGSGTLSATSTASNIRLGTGSSSFSGVIGQNLCVVWDGAGSLDFSGTNNDSANLWVMRNNGTLRLSHENAWKTTSYGLIANGASGGFTLELAAANESFNRTNLKLNNKTEAGYYVRFAAIGADRTVTWTGADTAESAAATNLVWNNGVQDNGTDLVGETLGLGNANATHKLIWASGINLNNNTNVVLTRKIDVTNGTAAVGGEISGVISDSGTVKATLLKTGSGTLILSGSNTYSGATVISNGILLVNGSITGVVNVVGGTLGGTGTVAGTVTNQAIITAAGTNSIGTLVVTNLVMGPNSTYVWNYYDASSQDVITVNAQMTLPTVATVKVSRVAGAASTLPGKIVLVHALNGIINPEALNTWFLDGGMPYSRLEWDVTTQSLVLRTPTGTLMTVW